MASKVLIANRGEIACRIIKTAKALGIRTLAIFSTIDANSRFVSMADEAVELGPPALDKSYLNIERIIEIAKKNNVKHFMYASSSSVYGGNSKLPFSEIDNVDSPLNLYAASKKCNELLAFAFSHINKIRSTGLRFFSVYGPFGRPDMAYFSFTDALTKKKIITLNNEGKMYRDMTYIEDIVDGIIGAINYAMNSNKKIRNEIFNLGNDKPIQTTELLRKIESYFNQRAKTEIEYTENESLITHADITKAKNLLGYDPKVSFDEGIIKFLDWYKNYENL